MVINAHCVYHLQDMATDPSDAKAISEKCQSLNMNRPNRVEGRIFGTVPLMEHGCSGQDLSRGCKLGKSGFRRLGFMVRRRVFLMITLIAKMGTCTYRYVSLCAVFARWIKVLRASQP